jgi:hypothetical protein
LIRLGEISFGFFGNITFKMKAPLNPESKQSRRISLMEMGTLFPGGISYGACN